MSDDNHDPDVDLNQAVGPEIDRPVEKALLGLPDPSLPDASAPIVDPNTGQERLSLYPDVPGHARRAFQDQSPEALQLKADIESGNVQLHAQLSGPNSRIDDRQMWSAENPDVTADFANDHGIMPETGETVAMHSTVDNGRVVVQDAWKSPTDPTPAGGFEVNTDAATTFKDTSFTVGGEPAKKSDVLDTLNGRAVDSLSTTSAVQTEASPTPQFDPVNPLDPPQSAFGNPEDWVAHRGSEVETAQLAADASIAGRTAEVLGAANSADNILDAVDVTLAAANLDTERQGWDAYIDHVSHQTGRSEPTIEVPVVEPPPELETHIIPEITPVVEPQAPQVVDLQPPPTFESGF